MSQVEDEKTPIRQTRNDSKYDYGAYDYDTWFNNYL